MSLYGAFDQTKHMSELATPLVTQGGVLTPAQRRALVLANLGLTVVDAELEVLAGVTPGTGAASKALVLSAGGDVTLPSGGLLNMSRGTLAALGTGAATAAPIVQQISVVTGADGTVGVALPAAATAEGPYIVINDSATAILPVYPVSGGNDNINAGAEDAAFNLGPGTYAVFIPTSATQWYTDKKAANPRTVAADLLDVAGVAAGYKIARSAAPVALGGSNPTSVAHGLTTCVAAFVALSGTAAPADSTHVLSVAINGANLDVYGWMPTSGTDPTLVASTGTESFHWIAIGT